MNLLLYFLIPLSTLVLFIKNIIRAKSSAQTLSPEKTLYKTATYLDVTILLLMIVYPVLLHLLAMKLKQLSYIDAFSNFFQTPLLSLFLIFNLILIIGLLISPFFIIRNYLEHRKSFRKILNAERSYTSDTIFSALTNILQTIKDEMQVEGSLELLILSNNDTDKLKCSGCCVDKIRGNTYILMDEKMYKKIVNEEIPLVEVQPIFCHELSHILNKDYKIPLFFKFIMDRKFLTITCTIMGLLFASLVLMTLSPDNLNLTLVNTFKIFILIIILIACLMGGSVITLSMIYQKCEIFADKLSVKYVPKELYFKALIRMSHHANDSSSPLNFSFMSTKGWAMDFKQRPSTQLKEYIVNSYLFFMGKKILSHPALFNRIELLYKKEKKESTNPLNLLEDKVLFLTVGKIFIILAIIISTIQLISNQNYIEFTKAIRFSGIFIFIYYATLTLKEKQSFYLFTNTHYQQLAYYALNINFYVNLPYMIIYFYNSRNVWSTITTSIITIIFGSIFTVFLLVIFIIISIAIKEKKA